MNSDTKIVAFYSYKGGVGRSMAALNMAYALAERQHHVLILDMDLEAPGLSGFLERNKAISGCNNRDIIDLIDWAAKVKIPLDPADFPQANQYVMPIAAESPSTDEGPARILGRLDIIPVNEQSDYYDRAIGLNLGQYDQDSLIRIGSVLRSWIQQLSVPIDVPDYYGPEAERTAAYDYVFVDSRTGVTETGGLCIGPLSDQLVILAALNDQNIEGTRNFFLEVGLPVPPDVTTASKPRMTVASLVPTGELAAKQDRLAEFEKRLGPIAGKLSYHPQLALFETFFTCKYPGEYLAQEYQTLVERLVDQNQEPTLVDWTTGRLQRDSPQFSAMIRNLLHKPSSAESLVYFLRTNSWEAIKKDKDFILWDMVFRELRRRSDQFDAHKRFWSQLLTEWSLQSKDELLKQRRLSEAFDNYQTILQSSTANQAKASALLDRGTTFSKIGKIHEAATDYSTVIAMNDATGAQKSRALVNRGIIFGRLDRANEAITDHSAVLVMNDATSEQRARALISRGLTMARLNRTEEAIADYSAVLVMNDVTSEQRARALISRGLTMARLNRTPLAIRDYSTVITMTRAGSEQKARALVNRGIAFGQLDRTDEAIADYSAVIAMDDAGSEQKARALVNRGIAFGKLGQTNEAIADYSVVIAMSNAPAEQQAYALLNRGITFGKLDRTDEAIADYSALLIMRDVSAELLNAAQTSLCFMYYQTNQLDEAIEHSMKAILSSPQMVHAHGNLAIALLCSGRIDEAIERYETTLRMASLEEVEELAQDLSEAVVKRGQINGADEVTQRIETRRHELISDFPVNADEENPSV